jgi:hypothetical protein
MASRRTRRLLGRSGAVRPGAPRLARRRCHAARDRRSERWALDTSVAAGRCRRGPCGARRPARNSGAGRPPADRRRARLAERLGAHRRGHSALALDGPLLAELAGGSPPDPARGRAHLPDRGRGAAASRCSQRQNLCLRDGQAVFVDWNLAHLGNPLLDAVAWLPSRAGPIRGSTFPTAKGWPHCWPGSSRAGPDCPRRRRRRPYASSNVCRPRSPCRGRRGSSSYNRRRLAP